MILFKREKFFISDPEQTILGDLIGRPLEQRTVLSAVHGLYTVAKRYEAFRLLKELNVFEGLQKHEFLGRLADLEKRYHTGLELMNLHNIFTPKGIEVYTLIDQICGQEIERVRDLKGVFELSNQPDEFSYEHFQRVNPIQQFLSMADLTA
ncbi:hypothetical protein [Spirosoma montaniterrae]|uniref:Uncharacterized protein n=1 Tax=Spirosoma montaniterrae TaxID=1178516 RepID=A0A1P9WWM0_9BACT|nr:hypothetical protein [Spirosoma montaniterrae]AQG79779.1 hypothetical protein AWR27_10855 [Spirosoma montaniterrae]